MNKLLLGIILCVLMSCDNVELPDNSTDALGFLDGANNSIEKVEEKIETAIKSLEESLKSDNKEEIEAKTKELMESSQKLGEKIYAEQQAQQPNSNSAPQEEKTVDAEVVDAEFEEVKQDKQDK